MHHVDLPNEPLRFELSWARECRGAHEAMLSRDVGERKNVHICSAEAIHGADRPSVGVIVILQDEANEGAPFVSHAASQVRDSDFVRKESDG